MTPPERDRARLGDMLSYAREAVRFAKGRSPEDLQRDVMLSLAVERAVEIVGEAAKGVSEATQAAHPEIPWRDLSRTRDFLAHAYFKLDPTILHPIAAKNLPERIAVLAPLLEAD